MCQPDFNRHFLNTTYNDFSFPIGQTREPFAWPNGVHKFIDSMLLQWDRSREGGLLYNLTPTSEDEKYKIPFFIMANANTTKLGCAFTVCNITDPGDNYDYFLYNSVWQNRYFVSFVCIYGPPHVSKRVPLYTKGPKCSECNGNCVYGGLCNRTTTK
ncbi:hypothetical protein KIN20_019745 [Parelaphostrongylus tenuis]|uniref:Uncharacterized protein n=1 Tax=Parelaphostrongylus tenuis TaxID=148309 RepID=A0AAD5MLI0_PARTN|nr:hypothetical protein KIN20_019745 [Parelaphostrongylus tenuis]